MLRPRRGTKVSMSCGAPGWIGGHYHIDLARMADATLECIQIELALALSCRMVTADPAVIIRTPEQAD